MITNGDHDIRTGALSPEIMWRNPLALGRAHLRGREQSDPYYKWADQAKTIRTHRANWDANHSWAA